MPDLTAAGWINGGPLTIAEMRGEVVVIDLFASWCPPCKDSTPGLMGLYLQYRGRGVQFLGVSGENPTAIEDLKQFVRETQLGWPVAYGEQRLFSQLQINSIPVVLIVGRDGKIIEAVRGFREGITEIAIEKAIETGLAQRIPESS